MVPFLDKHVLYNNNIQNKFRHIRVHKSFVLIFTYSIFYVGTYKLYVTCLYNIAVPYLTNIARQTGRTYHGGVPFLDSTMHFICYRIKIHNYSM